LKKVVRIEVLGQEDRKPRKRKRTRRKVGRKLVGELVYNIKRNLGLKLKKVREEWSGNGGDQEIDHPNQ